MIVCLGFNFTNGSSLFLANDRVCKPSHTTLDQSIRFSQHQSTTSTIIMSAPAPTEIPTVAIAAPPAPIAMPAPAAVAAPAVTTPAAVTAPLAAPVSVNTPLAGLAKPTIPTAAPSQVQSSSASAAPSRSSSGKSSSKKKKSSPPAAMAAAAAAAAAAVPPPGSTGAHGENTGRWTAEEHRLFLQGLELHGKGWKKIASLIKSRTVVQIRTHAQKYFQKLAKARQNGEEGEVAMEGRGGGEGRLEDSSPTALAAGNNRRRHSIGTKRKVIQSVVTSAQRQGKRFGAVGPDGAPLPTAAPTLATFVLPAGLSNSCVPSISTAQGTISGPALEDSLFRFLTPAPVASSEPQVNEVARSAGANAITLPSSENAGPAGSGEISPTGVTELSAYPSWTDAKDTPSWYSKGADVDALLDVGDTLDWLADTGDLHESYQPPAVETGGDCLPNLDQKLHGKATSSLETAEPSNTDMSVSALPAVDANNVDSVIPPLPSLFDGSTDDIAESMKKVQPGTLAGSASDPHMEKTVSSNSIDEHLQVFDTPMEEHDFVSTILENAAGSHGDLPALS